MNPSQESAQPMHPSSPPADPTADSVLYSATPHIGPSGQPETGGSPGAYGGGYGLAHPSGPLDSDPPEGYAARWWGLRRSSRRPWRRTVTVAVATGLAVLVLGGPLGLLWAWLAPNVPVIDAGQAGVVVNDPSPEEYIAADGWFTLLGLGFGLLVAIVAWLVLRRDRGPFLLLGVVAGTLGAGYLVAPWVGEMIGRSGYEHWRETAVRGATYMAPPEVHSLGPTLVPAFAAAIVLTLLAGWSNDPDLEQPGAKPGYGPNSATETYPPSAWEGSPDDAGSWQRTPDQAAEPTLPPPGPPDQPRG